jgi:hypothetical protein
MGTGLEQTLLEERFFCLPCMLSGVRSRLLPRVSLIMINAVVFGDVLCLSAFFG